MTLIKIVLKIYNRTRLPHRSNDECDTFTFIIFNYYKIMTDRSKQIIPDSQAVVRCLDPETLKILDSYGTFIISELLAKIKAPVTPKISREELDNVFEKSRSAGNNHRDDFFKILTNVLMEDTDITGILNILIDGTTCNLLQPDGKGWQKGKLKICFEFIPEEPEPVAAQDAPGKTHSSPLDEIRQLSNELTSMISIEQN
jgi:hypothetical protein